MGNLVSGDLEERGYSRRLCCSKETYDMIVNGCRKRIYKETPELDGMKLSQNYILKRVARWFLR